MPEFVGLFLHDRLLPGHCSVVGCGNPGSLHYGIRGARTVVVKLCPVHYGTATARRPACVVIERLTEDEVLVVDVMEG